MKSLKIFISVALLVSVAGWANGSQNQHSVPTLYYRDKHGALGRVFVQPPYGQEQMTEALQEFEKRDKCRVYKPECIYQISPRTKSRHTQRQTTEPLGMTETSVPRKCNQTPIPLSRHRRGKIALT